jgi:hypothetical protein
LCTGIYGVDTGAMKLARVIGHPPQLLMATPSDCRPNENGCRGLVTLRPGTLVMTFQSAEGFVCVEAAPEGGRRRWGWLPKTNLPLGQAQPSASPKSWVGQWSGQGYNEISISLEGGGTLHGEGYAEAGPHDNPRFAGFEGTGASSKGEVVFQGDDHSGCHVRIIKFGAQIAVMDNAKCGPMTRMSGFYRRTSDTPAPKGSVVGRG